MQTGADRGLWGDRARGRIIIGHGFAQVRSLSSPNKIVSGMPVAGHARQSTIKTESGRLKVFAGGDIVRGLVLVITTIFESCEAAKGIFTSLGRLSL